MYAICTLYIPLTLSYIAQKALLTDKMLQMRAGSNLSSRSPAHSSYDDWVEFARGATHGWHDEEKIYPYDNPHYDASWGHFSQMVWRNSTKLGCAAGRCSDNVEYPARFYCCKSSRTSLSFHPIIRELTIWCMADYTFFGNNIAAGQFQEQVWGPVCQLPSA